MKIGEVYKLKMTNIPKEPWFDYYLICQDRKFLTFSSLAPSGSQAQAEHFTMSRKEFRDGIKFRYITKGGHNEDNLRGL